MDEPSLEPLELIGKGASGEVWRARLRAPFGDLPAGQEVAVKTLSPALRDDPLALASLEAEVEAGRLVRDPSLVRVLHRGSAEEGPYLLLSYVPGRSLDEILDAEGALPEPLVRSIARQLASALAALHAAGLVHGDVKPENVRLDREGRAVLLDLGFAVRSDEDGRAHAGTIAFLSPERARGDLPSPEADVYALGVTLYELATGAHPLVASRSRPGRLGAPFARSSGRLFPRAIEEPQADEVLAALATARPRPPSALVPGLSPFFDALVLECLRRAPRERPTAAELAQAVSDGERGEWWRERVAAVREEGLSALEESGVDELPLVGREVELERLMGLWEHVSARPEGRESPSALVWLVGPAGSGKWRLVQEVAQRARAGDAPPLYLVSRWREASESRPCGAALDWLSSWLELPPDAAPGPRERDRIRALVPPDAARTLLDALDPAGVTRGESVPAALATWLHAISLERPVILSLDDLHRAGAVTLEALSILVDELEAARLLLLLAAREDVPAAEPLLFERLRARIERIGAERGAGEDGRVAPHRELLVERIELGPLDEEAILALVQRLFHHSTPQRRLARALWRATRGNVGLVGEVLRTLVHHGEAVPASEEEPELILLVSPDDLPVPRSLERLLAERLSSLAQADRAWLERLAVQGGRIDPDLLVQSSPGATHADLDPVLARLVRLGWLVPIGDRYRFERPALREAVYRGLSPGRRARLHLEYARALAPAPGEEESLEHAYVRAYHLRMAREDEELLALVSSLVELQRRRASAQRLYTLASWGLSALDALPPTPEHDRERVVLLEHASDAADRLGRREAQRELLDHLTDLELDHERVPGLAARLYLLHGRYAAGTGQLGLARGMLKNARELARAAHDDALLSEATRRLAQVQAQVGELVTARGLAERARLIAVGPNQLALAELELALFDVLEDRLEEALAGVDRALGALRGAEDVRAGVLAEAQLLRCRAWRAAGRADRAFGAARQALRTARRGGERQLESESHARLGVSLVDLDRPDEAEQELRDALLLADEIEDRRGQVLAGVFLALLLWEEDDAGARAGLERAIEQATDVGFYRAEAVARAILARVERSEGHLEAADRESERAQVLLERHGAELGDRIAVTGTRALVLNALGRGTEARALVRALRRRMREANRLLRDPALRRPQRSYTTNLLEAVLSPKGPVFPRVPRTET